MNRIGVIGAGPAGIMASLAASDNNNKVYLIEKNEKIGKKLFITGKGRCNITNNKNIEDFFPNILRNNKFLYSSLYTLTNIDLMNFFEGEGLKLKVERGDRVFPQSDKSSDVIKILEKKIEEKNIELNLNTEVLEITKNEGIFNINTNKGSFSVDKLIIATGGKSYEATGSTGDGYKFAEKFGHSVTDIYPGLVGFTLSDPWISDLSGITLKNVELIMKIKKKQYKEFGDILFTMKGISGPIVLKLSSYILDNENVKLFLDLKPKLDHKTLDNRLLREFSENQNKEIKTVLQNLLIKKLIPVFLEEINMSEDKKINQITSQERERIIQKMKSFPLNFKEKAGFREAVITIGGISTKEINPSTMESKIVENLYFAGELINVDALTGGYNLQIAFSTGYLAGINAGGSNEY